MESWRNPRLLCAYIHRRLFPFARNSAEHHSPYISAISPRCIATILLSKDTAHKSSIVYIPLQSTHFTPFAVTPPKDEEEFRVTAKKQHSKAYQAYFRIELPTRSNTLWVQVGSLEGSVVEDELATVKLVSAKIDQDADLVLHI